MISAEDLGPVRVITIARPPANVLSLELLGRLQDAVEKAAEDRGARALVIASSIPRYFSTGLDLEEMLALPAERREEPFRALLGVYRALLGLPKPSVAAIGGSAILGGWVLAMACDWRLLSSDGRIALSEIRLGLSPTSALIGRLKAISSSPSLVKELVLRGRTLRAEEALAGGFVDAVKSPEALGEEAVGLARSLAKQAPHAYASVKRALAGADQGADSWEPSLREFRGLFADPLTQEGIAAMREKRRPRWEG